MKNRALLVVALCLLVCISADATGSKEGKAAPRAKAPAVAPVRPAAPARPAVPAKPREPPPPPSLVVAGGIEVIRGTDRVIGGYIEATLVRGNFGFSLNGDLITLALTPEAGATAIGGMGLLSARYYGRLNPLLGNYMVAYFFGFAAGYGIIGYEDTSGNMGGMSYVGLAPVLPFGGEIGFQTVFANMMLVQSLVRVGGAYIMGNGVYGVYPFGSVSLSVGVLLE
jgi:hypothetical protein